MKTRSILQILLLSAVWGISFLMIRIAGTAFPPLWVAFLRCTLGAALLWTVLYLGGNKLPPRRLLPWLIAVALFNNAIPFTFFAWGERTVPSNIAAVINATTPIWTLLLSMTLHRMRPAMLTMGGVFLGFGGVLVVVVSHAGDPAAQHAPRSLLRGVIVISLAALGYAVATVMAKMKLQGLDPIGLATTQLTLAGLMILPLALAGVHPSSLRLAPIVAITVLGFAGSGFAYLLYYRLLSQVSATHVTAVTYLLPLWGLLWGLFAGESIGFLTCLGVAGAIAGLILLNLPPKETRARAKDMSIPCNAESQA
jgi:drug/metabolite transporter (DMT)-like permease